MSVLVFISSMYLKLFQFISKTTFVIVKTDNILASIFVLVHDKSPKTFDSNQCHLSSIGCFLDSLLIICLCNKEPHRASIHTEYIPKRCQMMKSPQPVETFIIMLCVMAPLKPLAIRNHKKTNKSKLHLHGTVPTNYFLRGNLQPIF